MSVAKHSAGLLPYRFVDGCVEVFIAHMGGPFWRRKDERGWSLAKGEFFPAEESAEVAAVREFTEEIGVAPSGALELLGDFRQPSGKIITVFVIDFTGRELEFVGSNEFELEWPRGSGSLQRFPEVDRAQWFALAQAEVKLVKGQVPILSALKGVATRRQPG